MKKFLFSNGVLSENLYSASVLFLRLFIGIVMLSHGIPKLLSFSTLSATFPDPLGLTPAFSLLLCIMAEVFCSILLIVGAFTRLATLPLIFNMLVIITVVHAGDPFSVKELPLFYLIIYLFILLFGPGKFSFDSFITNKGKKA